MVKQAIRQTYTYYDPDYPTGRIEEDAELQGRGRAWTLGSYEHPVYPSPLNVRVGNPGIKVWMVINWLRLCDDDVDTLLERYPQTVAREDVDVARWYYEKHKEVIDRRLEEEATED
jgi:uncharacterized protein (DUF433 family)